MIKDVTPHKEVLFRFQHTVTDKWLVFGKNCYPVTILTHDKENKSATVLYCPNGMHAESEQMEVGICDLFEMDCTLDQLVYDLALL